MRCAPGRSMSGRLLILFVGFALTAAACSKTAPKGARRDHEKK